MALQTYIIRDERDRRFALVAVQRAPIGMQVRISKPGRGDTQNAAIHAALTDIADQLVWPRPPANNGELHSVEWWKRRCTLGWIIEKKKEREIITSLTDEDEFALLLPHTSDLDVTQCAELREWILMFGATNGVVFREPKRQPDPPPHEDYYR